MIGCASGGVVAGVDLGCGRKSVCVCVCLCVVSVCLCVCVCVVMVRVVWRGHGGDLGRGLAGGL